MSLKVYFEDGRGNAMDEDGLEPVQMEVDEEANLNGSNNKEIHRGDFVKDMFSYYVYERGLTAGKAASIMNILRRTGYNLLKDDQDIIVGRLEGKNDDSRDEKLTERRGKKAILNEDHKKHLEETFDENPSATVDQAIDSLTSHFEGLEVGKKIVHNLMVNECALSFKKAYFYPAERNSNEKIQQRFE
ncbi:hypothetical protein INT47_008307 [Mucor saturninus]|uniref:Uncharacterized protein n=1 Tax=Mucor saturninus TaxID=64648 RepID=A0A8H7REG4_9FUNG|nr:hypothetical protein INT47_008307 [Mucor saturninus]